MNRLLLVHVMTIVLAALSGCREQKGPTQLPSKPQSDGRFNTQRSLTVNGKLIDDSSITCRPADALDVALQFRFKDRHSVDAALLQIIALGPDGTKKYEQTGTFPLVKTDDPGMIRLQATISLPKLRPGRYLLQAVRPGKVVMFSHELEVVANTP